MALCSHVSSVDDSLGRCCVLFCGFFRWQAEIPRGRIRSEFLTRPLSFSFFMLPPSLSGETEGVNKIKKVIALSLFLVVGVFGVVDGVVQSAALLALDGLARDEIAHVDHVAQFAEVGGGFDALEEFFGLLVE